MGALIVVLRVAFLIVCAVLTGIVLMQQGKVSGLSGAIGGAGETYWGKNKARSMEGGLQKVTVALASSYIIFAILLNVLV